jgi:hypothetical protein
MRAVRRTEKRRRQVRARREWAAWHTDTVDPNGKSLIGAHFGMRQAGLVLANGEVLLIGSQPQELARRTRARQFSICESEGGEKNG